MVGERRSQEAEKVSSCLLMLKLALKPLSKVEIKMGKIDVSFDVFNSCMVCCLKTMKFYHKLGFIGQKRRPV